MMLAVRILQSGENLWLSPEAKACIRKLLQYLESSPPSPHGQANIVSQREMVPVLVGPGSDICEWSPQSLSLLQTCKAQYRAQFCDAVVSMKVCCLWNYTAPFAWNTHLTFSSCFLLHFYSQVVNFSSWIRNSVRTRALLAGCLL